MKHRATLANAEGVVVSRQKKGAILAVGDHYLILPRLVQTLRTVVNQAHFSNYLIIGKYYANQVA